MQRRLLCYLSITLLLHDQNFGRIFWYHRHTFCAGYDCLTYLNPESSVYISIHEQNSSIVGSYVPKPMECPIALKEQTLRSMMDRWR